MTTTLEKMTLPDAMVVNDAEAMLNNFSLFKKLKAKGAFILYGHDPEQSKSLTDGGIRQITSETLASL